MTFNVDKCKVMHVDKINMKFKYSMDGQEPEETPVNGLGK
jgi:hypothetical protein